MQNDDLVVSLFRFWCNDAMDLVAAATAPFQPTDVHVRLARMAGRWTGTAKTYLDPDKAPEVAPWEGAIEMVLGGRYLRFAYASHAMGQPLAGELTVAFEKGDRVFRMSWIDSAHTSPAILLSESKPVTDAASTISAEGTYFAVEGEPRWGPGCST